MVVYLIPYGLVLTTQVTCANSGSCESGRSEGGGLVCTSNLCSENDPNERIHKHHFANFIVKKKLANAVYLCTLLVY